MSERKCEAVGAEDNALAVKLSRLHMTMRLGSWAPLVSQLLGLCAHQWWPLMQVRNVGRQTSPIFFHFHGGLESSGLIHVRLAASAIWCML